MKLGDVQFINSWPVTYALATRQVPSNAALVRGTPAWLNDQLMSGRLDVSAISAFAYLQHAGELLLLPELAIGSESGVNSVLLISRVPLRELAGQTIAVTDAGATTPVLLRILLEQAHGVRARYETTSAAFPDVLQSHPAALVIGDEALHALPTAKDDFLTWDLGALWRAWTGLPMVYAVWAARRDAVERAPDEAAQLHEALLASKAWGLAHLDQVSAAAAASAGFAAPVVADYYRGIRYELDASALAGLRRYAECAGLPQQFASMAAQGSLAPSNARKSEAIGPSDSEAGGRPGGHQRVAGGRRSC